MIRKERCFFTLCTQTMSSSGDDKDVCRRLVCICINADAGSTLGGSVANDIRNVINQCTDAFATTTGCVAVYPVVRTHADLVSASTRLARDCSRGIGRDRDGGGCSVLLYISGHGYQAREEKWINKVAAAAAVDGAAREEEDGMDEYIRLAGGTRVLDDELREKFYNVWIRWNKRSHGSAFVAVVDTCHSGTMLDFEHKVSPSSCSVQTIQPRQFRSLCISSCLDSGAAACDIGQTSGFGGAMTVHMLDRGVFGKLAIELVACATGETSSNGIDGKRLFEYLRETQAALSTAYRQEVVVSTAD